MSNPTANAALADDFHTYVSEALARVLEAIIIAKMEAVLTLGEVEDASGLRLLSVITE